jgi:AcrR family transcriptional regulator
VAFIQPQDTRARILEAARDVLRRHGEGKLTVVAIARKLGMSHANVYRFYKNKSEILDAIVEDWMIKVEAFIDAIARRDRSAAERLEAVVLELHKARRLKLKQDPSIFETYKRVIELRPEALAQRRTRIARVFEQLFEEGVAAGEFLDINCRQAAITFQDATSLFLHPLLIPASLKETTSRRIINVVRSILAGFVKPVSTPGTQLETKPVKASGLARKPL